ncbi:MAG: GNAT family N-acetyltransferase [Candidatus Accumulibacter sp. UW20]|jgi:ribosomal protein S18 acetylase RimI-like enzyme
MTIDPATSADIPELCELLSLLFAQEAEFTPAPEIQAQGLALIIPQPEVGVVLVARKADRVVGMVNLLYTISTALGARAALIEDLVVQPEARSAGVGSQLLTQAIALARARGCRRITLLTDRSNTSAQAFYRKIGFEPSRMIPMRLSLG